ncbi:MAG: aspartate/glutamate racemase family protein [Candidatus Heimdallarchaeota archaeon]|nr:aspartate/glutamate racemase family protein [Candidatus Heimdallarchaeota archaeon]
MKIIGLIGGMSWESSAIYYRVINQTVKRKLGGTHSAKSIMISVDFDEIEKMQANDEWVPLRKLMKDIAVTLEMAGADVIVICTNTMHKVADGIDQVVNIPLLHIADPTAESVKSAGITKIGLLGTKFTMEEDFYKGRLASKHGLDVIIPDEDERDVVHNIIYQELVLGHIKSSSREKLITIINNLIQKGAEGVILGCTEIGLLIGEADVIIPVFDTTLLHALAAVEFVL